MRVEADGFLDRGIIPAAERLGVNVHRATFSDIFSDELPWEVRESLTKFHEMSRKALPLNRTESEAWQAFVVAAYRGPDTIGYEPLADWLAAQGWSPSAAAELTAQFFEQCRLLTRYHDALVVA